MSKEYLEALGKNIRYKKEYIGNDTYKLYIKKNEIELLEKYLTELEQIKNAKPSEALKCVDILKEDGCIITLTQGKALETIRQALLKAQESKKYLKWEDLLFEENKLKRIKVKMGNHIYTVEYQSYKNEKGNIIEVADLWVEQRCISRDLGKCVFDDLHLEVLE